MLKLSAALAGAAAVAAASAAAAAPTTGICATVIRGPAVALSWAGRNIASSRYYASVSSYSCTSANRYMHRFIARRSSGFEARVAGGPRGFVCVSLAPSGYTLFQGACKSRTKLQVGFVWSLKLG
jgi:hypothetical protein